MHDRLFTDPPAIIGHRGFGKNAEGRPPENGVESLLAAVDAGAPWVEIDVRRTADDELVLLHNPAAADGTLVVEHTAAELRAHHIITLDDALAALPSTVGLDIEIKPSAEDALVPAERTAAALVCPALEREHGARRLLVSSFDTASLTIVRKRVPKVPLGYITWLGYPLDMAVATARQLGVEVLMAHTASFHDSKPSTRAPADVVEIAHEAGLELGVWSPPPETVHTYVAAGVDAITVDDIPGTIATLRDDT